MQRRRQQLAAIPEFIADDELLTRMLSADEDTDPNLAERVRQNLRQCGGTQSEQHRPRIWILAVGKIEDC